MLLSVVADDFGYCPERNQAIIDAFDRNAITDTSLLVNANYAEHASAVGNMTGLNIGGYQRSLWSLSNDSYASLSHFSCFRLAFQHVGREAC